jgi:hypothetical protein
MQIVMQTEVVAMLSRYLEAVPEHVQTWDQRVVDYLSTNVQAFQKFKMGTEFTRWEIIKSRSLH